MNTPPLSSDGFTRARPAEDRLSRGMPQPYVPWRTLNPDHAAPSSGGLARVPRRPRRARLTAESGPAAHAAPGAAAEPEDGPRQDSGGRRTTEGSFRMPGEAAPHRAPTVIDSPLGPLTLVAADGELVALHMDRWRHRPIDEEYGEPDPRPFQTAITQLGEYFDGRRTRFDLPLRLNGTPFQKQVWRTLMEIPYGETM